MKDARDELLYVGKSVNLRQRVSSYRYLRPEKHSRKLIRLIHEVSRISWEICKSDSDAQLRENYFLRTHRPKFNKLNTYPKAYFFIAISEAKHGFDLSLTRNRTTVSQVYGAFKVSAMHVFAALLRWLWIIIKRPVSADDFASRMFTSRLRQFFFSKSSLLEAVTAFLDGRSKALLDLIPSECAFVKTGFGDKLVASDLQILSHFFETSCRRNREFRSRFEISSPIISPEELDDLVVLSRFS